MINILFVCHGNICRSVAAEFIFKNLIKEQNLNNFFHVESRAISSEEIGNNIYPPMQKVLCQHNIELFPHCAKKINEADYQLYDYIFAMDYENISYLSHFNNSNHKIHLFKDFVGLSGEIEDPWYTKNYEKVFQELLTCCILLLEKLKLII